jgi:hypothetical protein
MLAILERHPAMMMVGIWVVTRNDIGRKMPNKMERRNVRWDSLEYRTSNEGTNRRQQQQQ